MKTWFTKLRQDTGAALITVLLVVSTMSAGAVLAFDALNFAIKRTGSQKLYEQARLFARGGEEMALVYAEKLAASNLAQLNGSEARLVRFPIGGGEISASLTDASNCFNVNSLVEQTDTDFYGQSAAASQRYRQLLIAIGLSQSEAAQLTATLTDWIDSDTRPLLYGAEDYDYSGLSPAYRTANTLLVDITELRLVKGYTEKVLDLVQPFLCARTTIAPAKLNVNAMTPDEAPLLKGLVGSAVSTTELARLIGERPAGGYKNVAAFWAENSFDGRSIDQSVRALVDVRPQAFRADILVTYYDARLELRSYIQMNSDGYGELTARQYTFGLE